MGLNPEIFSVLNVVRIFVVATLAFFVTLLITPAWTKVLHKYKLGKQIRTDTAFKSLHTEGGPIAAKLHQAKEGTPTMGGVVTWATVAILTIGFWFLAYFFQGFWVRMNFFSRAQTWLPLGAMMFAALLGALDDYLGILRVGPKGGGLRMSYRMLLYVLAGVVGAWWFYF
ncbi:MAG: hypothetical protein AAB857_03455, partial [Patescibacteria group bacterium]